MVEPSKMPHGGLGKLTEEAGEVVTVTGKYFTLGHLGQHWDGTNLKERLEDECADLMAAINYVIDKHGLDRTRMIERSLRKNAQYHEWSREDAERA